MSDDLETYIKDNENLFTKIRHHLHQNPELSCEEYETSAYIQSLLNEWGISYKKTGVSSVVATIDGNGTGTSTGKTIALRGDIDALPIQEETNLPWKSQKQGVMHACGHDVHTTFMLGCAKLLNEHKNEINGTVKIIFQEGEEIGAGAKVIMDSGLIDDVDTIIALHISQELDLGVFSIGYGVMSSYGAGGKITIRTEPDLNALVVAGECVSIITALAEEKFPKSEQIVMVPTMVTTEKTVNAKPVEVTLAYNTRTLNYSNEEIMQKVLVTGSEKISSIFNCKAEVELRKPGNVVNNDTHFTNLAASVIKKYFGEASLLYGRPVMTGEDFALYQKKIPGTYIHIGGAVNSEYRALHTSKTYVDDSILPIGIEFLIRYVFEFLS